MRESALFLCGVKRSPQHSTSKLWVLLERFDKGVAARGSPLDPGRSG